MSKVIDWNRVRVCADAIALSKNHNTFPARVTGGCEYYSDQKELSDAYRANRSEFKHQMKLMCIDMTYLTSCQEWKLSYRYPRVLNAGDASRIRSDALTACELSDDDTCVGFVSPSINNWLTFLVENLVNNYANTVTALASFDITVSKKNDGFEIKCLPSHLRNLYTLSYDGKYIKIPRRLMIHMVQGMVARGVELGKKANKKKSELDLGADLSLLKCLLGDIKKDFEESEYINNRYVDIVNLTRITPF